jgi:LacI family transcriptional regulator
LIRTLNKIAARDTQAIILKARELPEVVDAVNRPAGRGLPIVTIVTDLPTSPDNKDTANVLVTISSRPGRRRRTRDRLPQHCPRHCPRLEHVRAHRDRGLDATITEQLDYVAQTRTIDAVYSIGGGNQATRATLERHNQHPGIYIAHDLDADNRHLLGTSQISAVLHHDLTTDALRSCQLTMQAHRAIPGRPTTQPTPIQIITPYITPTQWS